MKEQEVIKMIHKLPKAKFFVRSQDDEISWQAGAVSDRIKISHIDSMQVVGGVVILKSIIGTWFGDKEVHFSIADGSVSTDGKIFYAPGPKIQIVSGGIK